jgi:hypothetical protein
MFPVRHSLARQSPSDQASPRAGSTRRGHALNTLPDRVSQCRSRPEEGVGLEPISPFGQRVFRAATSPPADPPACP